MTTALHTFTCWAGLLVFNSSICRLCIYFFVKQNRSIRETLVIFGCRWLGHSLLDDWTIFGKREMEERVRSEIRVREKQRDGEIEIIYVMYACIYIKESKRFSFFFLFLFCLCFVAQFYCFAIIFFHFCHFVVIFIWISELGFYT